MVVDSRHSRSGLGEEDMKVLKERILDDTRDLIQNENVKIKEEMGEFFAEIIKQMKIISNGRREERDDMDILQRDNEVVVSTVKALNGRLERVENQVFNYEMDLCTFREKSSIGIMVSEQQSKN